MKVEGNKTEASLEIRFSFMFWLRREKMIMKKLLLLNHCLSPSCPPVSFLAMTSPEASIF